MELERKIAAIQWSAADNRNPQKIYNPYTLSRLEDLLSNFPVKAMFSDLGMEEVTNLVVRQPSYLEALNKLAAETDLDTWKDHLRAHLLDEFGPMLSHSGLTINADDLIGNVKRIGIFDQDHMVDRLGKPVDRDQWAASPHQVNAYYQTSNNKFVVLAAILQPPFFDPSWSDAANYGGIGYVIGHEIGHGFDDQGSQFDGDGNLNNWWTEEDSKRFGVLKQKAAKKANSYEILPEVFLNGPLELGEIIGDLNGVQISLRAALRMARENGVDEAQATKDYFEQAGQTWRSKYRRDLVIKLIQTDGHPPGEYRTNGIFKNSDAFHKVYETKPGDGMWLDPSERVQIW